MSRSTNERPPARRILRCIAWGAGIQTALFALSVMLSGQPIAGPLVWNVQLGVALAGPLKLMGYDANGRAYHESTPLHLLAGALGLLAGIACYSLASWLVLRELAQLRRR